MFYPIHILALAHPGFVVRQLSDVFDAGANQSRRASFRRGWGLPDPLMGEV